MEKPVVRRLKGTQVGLWQGAPLLPVEGPRETRQGSADSLPGQQAGGQGLRRTPSTPPSRQQTAALALLK